MNISRFSFSVGLALASCLLLGVVVDDDGCEEEISLAAAREQTPASTRPAANEAAPNARQRRQNRRQAAQSQPAGGRRVRGQPEPAGAAEAEGTGPSGTRLTSNATYNTQPAVLARPDGKGNWVAWIGYQPGGGDFLFVAHEQGGKLEEIQQVTREAADLFRPVLVRSGETTMVLYTRTLPGKGPLIYASTLNKGKWSEPQPLPDQAPHTMNPEAAAMPGGAIAIVYQRFHENAYAIELRIWKAGKWEAPMVLGTPERTGNGPIDSWDPVVAYDAKAGKLLTAWVTYYPGEYDLCWSSYADGKATPAQRVARAGYDLHPSVLSDPKGGVWLAWDNITIPNHATSGSTFIKHPRSTGVGANSPLNHFYVAVAKWSDGQLTAPAGEARVTAEKEDTQHGGSPKLGFDNSGRLYVAYRTLHPPVSGRTMYYWDISTRVLQGAKWSDPVRLASSDGPTEEPAVVPGGDDSVLVFYQRDMRRTKTSNDGNMAPKLANPKLEAFFDHHGDFGEPKLRHGDVYVARVSSEGAPPVAGATVTAQPPAEKTFKQFERYHKDGYTVFFGDLHRHSNVSRCSRGAEPDPDDHYRYSRDVCRYDFLGISDHAAHTSDYNWWRLQKLADLYYTPGDFTTLFGVEWNGPEGHKNVMSPSRSLPLLATTGIAPNAIRLWAELDKWGGPAITIPHTSSLPGQDCDWTKHNEKYQRLVEIFQSGRGSFEGVGAPRLFPQATLNGQHVQDALAMKYRLGIICSSDHGYGATYACVYAKENTRESVFDALYDRRTYGSTTYGIIVDFNINGVMMGRDVKRGEGVNATGYVHGSGKLDKVQILKDNKVIQEWQPTGDDLKIDWKDPDAGAGLHWYYLRVIQEDDEMAWSSPSWVVD